MKPIRDHVAKDLGLTIVADEVYTPPLADATTLVQKIRSGRPDFIVCQSTNVGDDKLLLDKFAERGITASTVPLVGGGGHWTVPELMKIAGKEHLEGMIVGLANWPGKDIGDLEKRFVAKTNEPWFGHDSIFPVRAHHDLQGGAGADGVHRPQEAGRDDAQDRPQGRPGEALPRRPREVRRQRPPRRRRTLHRAVAEGAPGRLCIPKASRSPRRSGRSSRSNGGHQHRLADAGGARRTLTDRRAGEAARSEGRSRRHADPRSPYRDLNVILPQQNTPRVLAVSRL
jgi:hypothetical protein